MGIYLNIILICLRAIFFVTIEKCIFLIIMGKRISNKALIRMNNEYNGVETQLKPLCYSKNKKF